MQVVAVVEAVIVTAVHLSWCKSFVRTSSINQVIITLSHSFHQQPLPASTQPLSDLDCLNVTPPIDIICFVFVFTHGTDVALLRRTLFDLVEQDYPVMCGELANDGMGV